MMKGKADPRQSLAAAITKSASKQTYYTIRFFVDRQRVADAYRAYGYFRWVDDILDEQPGTQETKLAFLHRQQALLEACYQREALPGLCAEEQMLAHLVAQDTEKNSGLQTYLRNMMTVMAFDAARQGQIISQDELSNYTNNLATAVTEAMYYFIGHNDPAPDPQVRYQAVTAAHITHMLRDTIEDTQAGYFNIPREVLHRRRHLPVRCKKLGLPGMGLRASPPWRVRISKRAGKVLPRLKACAAAWRVMPIPRASNGCSAPSSGITIAFVQHTRNGRACGPACGWGMPSCFLCLRLYGIKTERTVQPK